MKNRWQFRSPWEHITLVASCGASADERTSAMHPERALPRLRNSLLGGSNAPNRRHLFEILSEIDGLKVNSPLMSTVWLQERLERAVRNGRLLAISSAFASGSGILAKVEPETPPETDAPAQEKETTWIEIKLLDFNDKPLAGHPYKLELPDGTVREGKVGADGLARITGIDPGQCKLTWKRQTVETYRLEEAGAEEKSA
jgi:hypothetical protein